MFCCKELSRTSCIFLAFVLFLCNGSSFSVSIESPKNGQGSAIVTTTPEIIRTCQDNCSLQFTIYSDGTHTIGQLSMEFSQHWLTPDLLTVGTVTATLGDGTDLSANLSLGSIGEGLHNGTDLILNPAMITATGETDHVVINISNQHSPDSPGQYPVYVQTAELPTGTLQPIDEQPEITVFSTLDSSVTTVPDPIPGGQTGTSVGITYTNTDASTTYSPGYFLNYRTFGDGTWQIGSSGNGVQCTNNSTLPSCLLSDIILYDAIVYFDVRINTTSDDDFAGWVFRYQDENNFCLFDWKKTSQSMNGNVAPAGRCLKRVINGDFNGDGISGDAMTDIWEGQTGRSHVLSRDGVPWSFYTTYSCKLEMIGATTRLFIDDMSTPVLEATDSNFPGGRFGPYTFSQQSVLFENISIHRLSPSINALTMEIPPGWSHPEPGTNLSIMRGDGTDLTSFAIMGGPGGGSHGGTILTLELTDLFETSPGHTISFDFNPFDSPITGSPQIFYSQVMTPESTFYDIASHPEILLSGTLADGTGSAFITPDSVFTGSLSDYDLTIQSDGTWPLENLRVTVPAGFTQPIPGGVSAIRSDGLDLTGSITFNAQQVSIENAGITVTPPADSLTFTFSDVSAPGSTGIFTWNIETAGDQGNLTDISSSPQTTVISIPTVTPTAVPTITPTTVPTQTPAITPSPTSTHTPGPPLSIPATSFSGIFVLLLLFGSILLLGKK